jgi:uncharacterized protein YkwD
LFPKGVIVSPGRPTDAPIIERHRPTHLLVCVLAAAALVAPASVLASRGSEAAARTNQAAAFDSSVLIGLNEIRIAHGLVPLTLSPELTAAAEQHSRDMITYGYFAHSSSDGAAFWQRIAEYYPSPSTPHWSVGENLLWSSGQIDASAGLADWMASPEHRANILFPGWRQVGIAEVTSPDAPGIYGGLPVSVITTDFGVRGD